ISTLLLFRLTVGGLLDRVLSFLYISFRPLLRVFLCKRLVRTVLIFTESSDQLSRATDRVPGLPASPGY
nr:hypothetical protein [Escherichia coli]